MFDFRKKDLADLQTYKLKNSLNDVPTIANHLYILNDEVIFLQKSRNKYQVCCSPQCHAVAFSIGSVFDVIYEDKEYDKALNQFLTYVFKNIRSHTWR